MAGFVYIMSNPAFPLLKIGRTNRDPDVYRKEELDVTGLPEPFKVEYYVYANDYITLEMDIHRHLDEYRPNKGREFFNCSIEVAIDTIREIGGDKIKFEQLNYEYPPKKPPPKKPPPKKPLPKKKEPTKKEIDAETRRLRLKGLEAIEIAKQNRRGYSPTSKGGKNNKMVWLFVVACIAIYMMW